MPDRFQPVDRSCVAAGSLNPGIIEPGWLMKMGIALTDEATWDIGLTKFDKVLVFRDDALSWSCSASRLVVTAVDPNGDPGAAIAKVLKILEHTPIQAVGNNFAYLVEPETGTRLAKLLRVPIVDAFGASGARVDNYTTALVVPKNEARLTMIFDASDTAIQKVTFNFHRPTVHSAVAAEAAAKWKTDESTAVQMLEDIATWSKS
jgi:hypothetical protein